MRSKKKIVIIDDDKDFGFLLSGFFLGKNFNVLLAHTLTEGMIMLAKERPDHIFLDNGLPDGFGWEKAQFILSEYPLAHLNLISAWRVPKISSSAYRILEKPISLVDLISCVEE
jgi:DNA-binding response OmpR family regulator